MNLFILILVLLSPFSFAGRFIIQTNQSIKFPNTLNVGPLFLTTNKILKNYFIVSGNISFSELQNTPGITSVELPHDLFKHSLLPGKKVRAEITDDFFPFQWGLLNSGQTYFREKTDIENKKIIGLDGFDVGVIDELVKKTDKGEKIIVAILDSGVDLNHPELKDHLWKNENECGKDPSVDHDGNKLKGDCHGWNFTEAIESAAAKNPSDLDGHGTHVAGIIAAENNGKGILGVAQNALIMPIKVLKDTESQTEISSSEAFARGIIYAVDNGAKIINMSLGWPRSLETKFLRDAVTYALDQGVIIVAAAGNNNSPEPLFPCSYEGVICVASSSLNGEFSGFSNFGGHIDLVAPGEGILSLHPTNLEPELFSAPGFEIRSGTSQSAPFVTGLIARVLSSEPDLKIDDFFARAYLSKPLTSSEKFIHGGLAHFSRLSSPVNKAVLVPVFKRVRQILFKNNQAKISIPIRNYGVTSEPSTVLLKFKNLSVEVKQPIREIPKLTKGEGVELEFELELQNSDIDQNLEMEVEIYHEDQKTSFKNIIPGLLDLRTYDELEKIEVKFQDKVLPLGGVRNGELVSFLNTLEVLGEKQAHELYLRRTLKDSPTRDLEITLFRRDKNLNEVNKKILVPFALNIVNFYKVDLNFDGVMDYFLHVLCEKEEKKFFKFIYLNSDLFPLWKNYPAFDLYLDLYLASMNDLSFVKVKDDKLGWIRVPAFVTEGQLPLIDQNLTVWETPSKNKKKLFYFLERYQTQFRVRSPTHLKWEKQLKEKAAFSWRDSVEIEALIPSSLEDFNKGQIKLLLSVGETSKRKWFKVIFSSKELELGPVMSPLIFQTEEMKPLISLEQNKFESQGEVYFNIYDKERSKIIYSKDLGSVQEKKFQLTQSDDLIVGHLGSFIFEDHFVSFIQTKEKLVWLQNGAKVNSFERPLIRYSFLSQKNLSEMYLPITIKRAGRLHPAVYVDMTSITGNRLAVLDVKHQNLSSRINKAYSLPSSCKTLNPYFNTEMNQHELVFVCLENQQWSLKILPLVED